MRSSSGCCPRLGNPLGFQPVFACVSKSLEEILTENAQQYVALLEGFNYGSPYRLEILNKIFNRIFNQNLFPYSLCDPWIIRVWSVDLTG